MVQNLWKMIYMNIVFTLYLSVNLSLTGLLPQIADQNSFEHLSTVAILCIYGSEIIGNFIVPKYLSHLPYRLAFIILSLFTLPCFVTSYFVANGSSGSNLTYSLSMLSSCVFGFGLAGSFIVQNVYVSACAVTHSELFFGLTYMMMGFSSLLSGIFSEYGLKVVGREQFFYLAGVASLSLGSLFGFVRNPKSLQVADQKIQASVESQDSDIKEIITKLTVRQRFQDPQVQKYFILFFSSGISMGLEYSLLYKLIDKSLNEDEETVNERTARVFQFMGLAQAMSGMINGISKCISPQMNSIMYSKLFSCFIIIGVINYFENSFTINCVLALFLGLADNSGQFNSAHTISTIWKDDPALYGLYFCFQNSAVIIITILSAQIYLYIPLLILLIIIAISLNMQMHHLSR